MPKVKIPRKSTWIDMTAMTDVAFLLLTFFMLTSNFVKKEPVLVSTPSSVSEIKIPETNVMTIIIDKEGKVFVGIDGQEKRRQLLEKMGESYHVTFTPQELKSYTLMEVVGNPMKVMKAFLTMPVESRDLPGNNMGVPADSTDNQFKVWVQNAFNVNSSLIIAIKADEKTPYSVVKKVMKSLQEIDKNRYNLVTRLEGDPLEAKKK
jgi:biopolymer transport protein ExbD